MYISQCLYDPLSNSPLVTTYLQVYLFYTYQWVTCELRWVGLLLNLFAVQISEVLNNGSVN